MVLSIPPGARRTDLHAAGWSDGRLQRALRAGTLTRVAFDTYVVAGHQVSELGHLLAASGRVPVLSHRTAARAWGLPVAPTHVDLTVPRGCARRAIPSGVVLHQSPLAAADVELVEGVRVTAAARTLLDLARTEPLDLAVVAIDAALHSGLVTLPELEQLLARCSRWPWMRRAAIAVEASDGRAESPLESLLRVTLVHGGVPPHDVQRQPRGIGRVDFWYDGVVVEGDGFAFHSDRDAFREDRRRNNACAAAGLLVLRFTWEDVHRRPDEVVATVRSALRHCAERESGTRGRGR